MLFICCHCRPSGDFLAGPVTAHAILADRVNLADADTWRWQFHTLRILNGLPPGLWTSRFRSDDLGSSAVVTIIFQAGGYKFPGDG